MVTAAKGGLMSSDLIFNSANLAHRLNTPWISASSHQFAIYWIGDDGKTTMHHTYRLRTGSSLHSDKSNEKITHGSWAESVEIAQQRFGLDPHDWRPASGPNGQGYWFPGVAAEAAKAGNLYWRDNPKSRIKFGPTGRPCTVIQHGNGHGSPSHACGRLAVIEHESSRMGSEDGIEYRCKLHQSVVERADARDVERKERQDARTEERERKNANRSRCEEVLEKIRPLLAELGIHPDTLSVGTEGARVGILLPAEVAELLTSNAVELNEVIGGDF